MSTPPVVLSSFDPFQQLTVIRQAASSLASSFELDQTLANTIGVFLPALGDFGFFDAIVDGGVRRTARAHLDPATEAILAATEWRRQAPTGLNLCALSSGEAALHTGIDDAWYQKVAMGEGHLALLRTLRFKAMLTVPVRAGEELVGALTLFMSHSGRSYGAGELAFAAELAALAAPVVSNARLLGKHRLAEAALRASGERLRLATDAGKIGIWDWDLVSGAVSWSERVYELHGLAPGQFGGRLEDFTALVHPDDRERLSRDMAASLASGDLFTAEFRIVRPDGSGGWLATWAQPENEGGRGPTRMVGATIEITEQKRSQARLEELNCRLEQRVVSSNTERDRIWRMSRDVLAVASQSGALLSVNPAFEAVLGWTEREALSTPFMQLVHPEQQAGVQQQLARLARGESVEEFEVRSRHRDGSYRWLSWTLAPEGDLMYGVGRDVTELKKERAKKLLASETRLQLALDVGGMGAWQWDVVSGESIWWPGMETLHGMPVGAGVSSMAAYLELVLPADRERLAAEVEEALREKRGHRIEYRVIHPGGGVRWIEGRGELTLDEHGAPVQMAGVCVDITQRKRTEEDLRFVAKASAELAALTELTATLNRVARLAVPGFADWCTVDLLGADGAIERVAVAHVDPSKEALVHELFVRFPPDPDARGGVWQAIRGGHCGHVPLITDAMLAESAGAPECLAGLRTLGLRSYIGVPLAVRGRTLGLISFVAAGSGRVYGADDVALAEDIGQRAAIAIENANMYRALQTADRRKDEFLAMLAHELRNPLAPIAAAADVLRLSTGDARLTKVSDIISRQVGHMAGLIDDLLDVSRVTRGQVELDRYPVDMKAVVMAAVEQVRSLNEARGHRLSLKLPARALTVEGDEKRLVQIVANLLNNAAKYTPPGGAIDLEVEAGEERILLRVRDNGIGMAPELVDSAFELFAQAARTSDRSQGGLGLGLALVRRLAELHGGRARAASKGPGHGSEFTVHLPLLRGAAGATGAADGAAGAAPQARLQVLVVDDNVDAATMLGLFLETSGHEVDVCHEPRAALERIGARRFDACLLDIGLPGMDGNELARQIRVASPGAVPALIAVSGYGQAHDRAVALEAGFDHYLVKPVGALSLQELLAQIAGRSALV
ncbi:PAS domain-containing protein [Massilia glaciei]|uniref:histidine kinase n=1 Tax=Massilia glaciei TaxID=1524097 RepID=A0A2U2I583_9BURK|nr:PAS domain-containing protein [Massilia glaciei]PWF54934.1 PAS domain S-box protein [Massilia glaciei]